MSAWHRLNDTVTGESAEVGEVRSWLEVEVTEPWTELKMKNESRPGTRGLN